MRYEYQGFEIRHSKGRLPYAVFTKRLSWRAPINLGNYADLDTAMRRIEERGIGYRRTELKAIAGL